MRRPSACLPRGGPRRRPRASRRSSRRRRRESTCRGAGRRDPDPGRVGEPLPAPPAHLTAAASSPEAPLERQPGPLRRRNRDLLGRIEAPPAPAPGARRRREPPRPRTPPRGRARSIGRRPRHRASESLRPNLRPWTTHRATPSKGDAETSEVNARRPGLTHPRGRRKLRAAALAEDALGRAGRAAGRAQRGRDEGGDLFDQRWRDRPIVQGDAQREARTVPRK